MICRLCTQLIFNVALREGKKYLLLLQSTDNATNSQCSSFIEHMHLIISYGQTDYKVKHVGKWSCIEWDHNLVAKFAMSHYPYFFKSNLMWTRKYQIVEQNPRLSSYVLYIGQIVKIFYPSCSYLGKCLILWKPKASLWLSLNCTIFIPLPGSDYTYMG